MLPGFCTGTTDIQTSFKSLARALGMAINERPDLRLTICQVLRVTITKSCNTGKCRRSDHRVHSAALTQT